MDEHERRRLHHQSLIETSKALTESGPMWLWSKEKILSLVKQTSGEQQLIDAIQTGKGVIVVSPHLGCWEMAGLYCSSLHPMTSLYRPPRLAQLDNFIMSARQRFGGELVPTNASGVRKFFQAVKNGKLIGILPDQDPGTENGEFASFFGVQAYTMTLLSRIAQKFRPAVFFTYAERLPNGAGYHLHFNKAGEELYSESLSTSVQCVNKEVENCARALPEQYQWGYKRFKTRPPGEEKIY
jgi:KDO2-lipid IV(A) lauroyltransferase